MATRRPKSHGPNTIPMPLSIHRGKHPELAAWIDTLPLGAGATRVRTVLDEMMRLGLLLPGGRLGAIGTDAQQQSLMAQNSILRDRMQELEVENAMLKRRLSQLQPELFDPAARPNKDVTTGGMPLPGNSTDSAAEARDQEAPTGTQGGAPVVHSEAPQGRPVDRQTAMNWAGGLRPGANRPGGGR